MYLVTSQQMRAIDQKAINEYNFPEAVLMENAGRAVTEVLAAKFPNLVDQHITIAVGTGNNGGDGLVIARYLHKLGAKVKVFLAAEKELNPSTQLNLNILEKLPVKIYPLDTENSVHLFKVAINTTDIFIDALLGTGLNRPLSPLLAEIVDIVNKRTCLTVAVDVPTGLNCDTGEIYGNCLVADYTIGIALPKQGYYLNKGVKYCGEITIVDIGFPEELLAECGLQTYLLDSDYLQTHLQQRQRNSHKGTYGHLLLVGGSMGMSGAVTLAARSSYRAGVGAVSCAVPADIQLQVAVNIPEAMVYPVNEGAVFTDEALEKIDNLLKGKKAVVLGPGMGKTEYIGQLVQYILQESTCPIVLDADGLNALNGDMELLNLAKAPLILTPHPGEMARLLGTDTKNVQNNRLETAGKFAAAHQVWVILKGANTIIAAPSGEIYLNTIDSPALAVAGSGDVLAGILGALLAQGMSPEEACCMAVRLHGEAGVLLAEQMGTISTQAGDIIEVLPQLLRGETK